MSTALVIATREIRERSRLFVVAAAFAVIPFLAALVPGAKGNRAQAIMVVGVSAAVAYGCAIALAMGVSTIGRDLSEKRLSFYFSKPISPAALWSGKAVASLLIAMLSMLIITGPAYLAARDAWHSIWKSEGPLVSLFPPLLVVVLFFGSHAVATMARSRSILIAFDFVMALVFAGASAVISRSLILGGGNGVAVMMARALAIGLLATLVLAPVWQLSRGRTDSRRSHTALSKALWTSVAVMLVLAGGYFAWLRSATPSSFRQVLDLTPAPASGLVSVSAWSAGRGDYVTSMIVDTETGAYSRLEVPWMMTWSRDGRAAAWARPVGFFKIERAEIITRNAVGAHAATGIYTRFDARLALTDDGARLAVADDGNVTVYDVATRRILAAAAGFKSFNRWIFFVTPDVVRLMEFDGKRGDEMGRPLQITELDVSTRTLTTLGNRSVPMQYNALTVSGDGSRMFIRTTGEIVDARTLAPLAKLTGVHNEGQGDLARVSADAAFGSSILYDGDVVTIDKSAGVRLRMFDRQGQPRGELVLPRMTNAYLAGETADGRLIVNAWQGDHGSGYKRVVMIVDRARAVIERSFPGLTAARPDWQYDPRLPRYRAGKEFVAQDDGDRLVICNLATGAMRKI